MKISHTIFLAIAVAAALVYVLAVDREQLSTEQKQALALKLTDFTPQNIGAVEIENAGEEVRLVYRENRWQTRRPATDLADPEVVVTLLTALNNLKIVRPVDLSVVGNPGEKLEDLGLADPRQEVLLKGDGPPRRIVFGNEDPSGQLVYAQEFPGERIAQISSDIKDLLFRDPDEFRDPIVIRVAPEKIKVIRVESGQGDVQLVLENGFWQFSKPLRARADNQQVFEMIKTQLEQPIAEFVTNSREELVEYGLVNPRATISFWTAAEGEKDAIYELEIGKPVPDREEFVFASEPARDAVFIMPQAVLEPARIQLGQLRDRALVDYPVAAIERLEVTAGDGEDAASRVMLERGADGWYVLLSGNDRMPADQAAVAELLRALANAEIEEFVADVITDEARYGLDQADHRLVLHNSREHLERLHQERARQAGGQVGGLLPPEMLPRELTLEIARSEEGQQYVLNRNKSNIVTLREPLPELPRRAYGWRSLRLHGFNPARIVGLSYDPDNAEESLSFTREPGGIWELGTDREDFPNPAQLTDLAQSAVAALAVLRGVDWASDEVREEHGFTDPQLVVEYVVDDRDQPWRLIVGAERPGGGAYYARIDGVSGVFLLSQPHFQVISAPQKAGVRE